MPNFNPYVIDLSLVKWRENIFETGEVFFLAQWRPSSPTIQREVLIFGLFPLYLSVSLLDGSFLGFLVLKLVLKSHKLEQSNKPSTTLTHFIFCSLDQPALTLTAAFSCTLLQGMHVFLSNAVVVNLYAFYLNHENEIFICCLIIWFVRWPLIPQIEEEYSHKLFAFIIFEHWSFYTP